MPARAGGLVDASRLPLAADTEELLQIEGLDGTAALANRADGYRVRLSWQKEHFPSLLLWYSNRGRKAAPWNGRHVAIGIEPICSPFGLGPATALADNPIARSGIPTALEFLPERPFADPLPHRGIRAVTRIVPQCLWSSRTGRASPMSQGWPRWSATATRFGVGGHHFARLPIALLRAIARSRHQGPALRLLGRRATARAAARGGRGSGNRPLLFQPRHFWPAAAFPRGCRDRRDTGSRLDGAGHDPGAAGGAAEPAVDAVPASGGLGHAGARARRECRALIPLPGSTLGFVPPLRLDTVVVHAQRADESGNVQIIGPRALDFAMAGAARKVLVTVEEIVPVGALRHDGRQSILTRNQVSAIALAPGGAYPASCLPFYVTDYQALSEAFAARETPLADNLRLPSEGVPATGSRSCEGPR